MAMSAAVKPFPVMYLPALSFSQPSRDARQPGAAPEPAAPVSDGRSVVACHSSSCSTRIAAASAPFGNMGLPFLAARWRMMLTGCVIRVPSRSTSSGTAAAPTPAAAPAALSASTTLWLTCASVQNMRRARASDFEKGAVAPLLDGTTSSTGGSCGAAFFLSFLPPPAACCCLPLPASLPLPPLGCASPPLPLPLPPAAPPLAPFSPVFESPPFLAPPSPPLPPLPPPPLDFLGAGCSGASRTKGMNSTPIMNGRSTSGTTMPLSV
mmetsp:Transcript_10133/g.42029  ORF Transcript_10133/g.42029 Transcript_10133/m.42029 type:complete len:266 (-) Transcript_10133:1314-2111(-)